MNAIDYAALSLEAIIHHAENAKVAGTLGDAIGLYQGWLEGNREHDGRAIAFFNLGVVAAEAGKPELAVDCYQQVIELSNNFPQARINLGLAFERLGRHDDATQEWSKAIEAASQTAGHEISFVPSVIQTTALNHIGRLYESRKIYDLAEDALRRSLEINPGQADAAQHWLHLRQRQCKWDTNWAKAPITESFALRSMSPLAALAHTDDPIQHLAAAANFVSRKFAYKREPLWSGPLQAREKVRVGYVSGDLCTHAVGLLMQPWLAAHDRGKFELFAFDFSPEDGTNVRQGLKEQFDYFLSIKDMPDQEAAILIRRCDIDILVDMHGLSSGARPEIFAYRPAAVNATLLGFLGTSAMEWNDWILADTHVIPPGIRKHYTEEVIYLPNCILPMTISQERKQSVAVEGRGSIDSDSQPPRKRLGCFNNAYKYTPEIVAAWARSLRKHDDWELWLLDDNEVASVNIEKKLIANGAKPNQIVWHKRSSYDEYLTKLGALDLYADTYPYNAGSTARDVLTSGVPIVTLAGRSYMSRVAASAVAELAGGAGVTHSLQEYEDTLDLYMSDDEIRAGVKRKISHYDGAASVAENVATFEKRILVQMEKLNALQSD